MATNTTSTPKLTKAQKFAMLRAIPAVAENAMLVEFIDHEVELLTKKNSDSGKLTKLQQENMKLTEAVYEGMEADKPYTITDIIKSVPAVAGLNTSKVRPLMTPLMNDGRVVREEGKGGRPFFTKVK